MKPIFTVAALLIAVACLAQTKIIPAGRTIFTRLEKSPAVTVRIKATENLRNLHVTGNVAGVEKSVKIAEVKADSDQLFEIPLENNLRLGDYSFKIVLRTADREIASAELPIQIISGAAPDFPVIMNGPSIPEKLRKFGFTHALVDLNPEAPEQTGKLLDNMAGNAVFSLGLFDYTRSLASKYPRLNCNHKPYSPPATDASNPEVLKSSLKVAETTARIFGAHPALAGVYLNPNAQANTNPSFDKYEPAAFKKSTGLEVPSAVTSRICPNYQLLKDFPGNRIVPAKYPLWVYYQWFWTVGDGWNPLDNALGEMFRSQIKHPFFTINEMSSNTPPFSLSAHPGYPKQLSRKIHSAPEPLIAAYETDCLIAAGAGKPSHPVIPDLDAGWSRAKVAPGPLTSPVKPLWVQQQPEAKSLTVSPDVLRESFWAVISRRIDGISYNGNGVLAGVQETAPGCYAARESAEDLEYLLNKVLVPLGPMLKKLPERKPEVLVLYSAASAIFADDRRNWIADLYMALQWSNFQVSVVYEDQIRHGVLDNASILVMPGCEVLDKDVFDLIRKFQDRAGFVIADEYLVPGIVPDLMIRPRKRESDPAANKAAFQRLGADLRKALEPHFKPYVTTGNQDLVVRVRSYKEADYLFVINDKRGRGEYVGNWGKVLELGLPNSGNIYVGRNMNYGYNLVSGEEVIVANLKSGSGVGCSFESSGGCLIMLLQDRINQVTVNVSPVAKGAFKAEIQVLNEAGKPVQALLPLEIALRGADDKALEGSGYYCAVDGVLNLEFRIAANEPAGNLKLLVRDVASGKTAIGTVIRQDNP